MSLNGQSIKINNLQFNVVMEGRGTPVILLHVIPGEQPLNKGAFSAPNFQVKIFSSI